jgi:hypothetical protein
MDRLVPNFRPLGVLQQPDRAEGVKALMMRVLGPALPA